MLKDSLNISEAEEMSKVHDENISLSNNTSQSKKIL